MIRDPYRSGLIKISSAMNAKQRAAASRERSRAQRVRFYIQLVTNLIAAAIGFTLGLLVSSCSDPGIRPAENRTKILQVRDTIQVPAIRIQDPDSVVSPGRFCGNEPKHKGG